MTVRGAGEPERVLAPVERLSEILFGLIMVLSFTCSISVASAGREEVRAVLAAAIGCNLAWGLVDAIMYLLTILLERGRALSIARAVRASSDPAHGRRMVAEVLPEPLGRLLEEEELERVRARVVALPPRARPGLTGRDLRGALGVFLLVFLSTFPVVVPFLFVSPVQRALRVSNAVALVLLFVVGRSLGRYAGLRPGRTGAAMVAIGVVLVGLTIALGG